MGCDRSALHLADVDEVVIVVVGVVGREELVGASDIFSCCVAHLEYAQIEVEEDFVGGVMVVEAWQVGRKVGNEVSVVDYSVDSVEGLAHVVGELDVAQPRLSEVVNEHLCRREKRLEFHRADRRDSSPQSVSSGDNARTWVLLEQRCDFTIELLFEKQIIHIEASVHLAACTSEVGDLLKVPILDPILKVAAASEGEHDLVVPAVVANVSRCFGDGVLHVEGFEHWNALAPAAGPGRYAVRAAEREGRQLGQLLRIGDVVGRSRLFYDGMAVEAEERGEE